MTLKENKTHTEETELMSIRCFYDNLVKINLSQVKVCVYVGAEYGTFVLIIESDVYLIFSFCALSIKIEDSARKADPRTTRLTKGDNSAWV